MKRPKRVLLALGWYDYRLHRGIERYALEHGWHLCPDVTKEKVIPWGWDGDGILAWLGAGDDLAEFVMQARKPTVDFSYRRKHLPFPRVLVDHKEVAKLVADHFISRGLKHVAYYSDVDNWAFNENGSWFIQFVAARALDCVWLKWHESPDYTTGKLQWQKKRKWLAAQLKRLPKPLGVFAANDDRAIEVLEVCEAAGLKVPEEVGIVGVDNSIMAVDAMQIPVSSVDTNLELVGYMGATLLDKLMHGHPPPTEPLRIPPKGLVVRKSSDLLAVQHEGVARALRYMWENFNRPIGVEDLARLAGMSRRSLHTAFVLHLGRTPGAELHNLRIQHAKKLLVETEHKVETISAMCGYSSLNSFSVAFKNAVGIAPAEFRAKFKP
ncbi:MAG: DNA-binding transcriptional regulator [Verrucomicrobiae bacterium]|nr:DNA-binding transcriptional regulator [Verrucomicrobiae bacterium]MDW7979892.1 DNA-binding transcriptional regulator [Verrucomicrobiales bacterium]